MNGRILAYEVVRFLADKADEAVRWMLLAASMAGIVLSCVGIVLRVGAAFASPDTCPNGNGWTKVDSDDLSLYPADGATEYCFKAGQWVIDYIPDGGFGQDGSCNDGPQYCDLSHWSYFIPEPTEEPTDVPTPTPTNEPQPTDTDEPGPTLTPTDEPREPTPTPTEDDPQPTPTVTEPPVEPTPGLPSAGFTSQYEIITGEPWQLSVPGNAWAGHNQEGWPASEWWKLWEGQEFLFNGQWFTTAEYIIADPTEVELIGRATDFDLMLITCRNYSPVTNEWAERLVIFANLSSG